MNLLLTQKQIVCALLVLCGLGIQPPLMANEPEDQGQPANSVWISPGFYSIHFDRNSGLKDANAGFGVQWNVRPEWSLTAGRFSNSNSQHSNYAGVIYMPWSWGPIRVGGVIAGFDGYPNMRNGGWFATVVPTIGIYGSHLAVNIGIIPELKDRVQGAIAFQLMLRVH